MMRQYDNVIRTVKRAGILNSAKRVLLWDQRAMMPSEASHIRSLENVALATAIHRTMRSRYLGKHIKEAEKEKLTDEEKANLREIKKDHNIRRKISQSQITKLEKLKIKTMKDWEKAKEQNDFTICIDNFQSLVDAYYKYGRMINKKDAYQGLLQEHEPDLSVEEIKKLFSAIKRKLGKRIKEYKPVPKQHISNIEVHGKTKYFFNKYFLETIGFDFSKGRMDYATKAFSGAYGRICITNRPWINELRTALHEGGHSMYELGLPDEHYGTPLAQYRSTTIDETQSLIWERHIGKETAFWKYFESELKNKYDESITANKILKDANYINKSIRRGGSDEISYLFHIIIRFEIEEELFNKKIKVKDLPKVWNKKYKKYFNKEPKNFEEGLLSDVHWSKGSFGYFPCYAIGAIIAAQMYEQMGKELDVQTILKEGKMYLLRNWLHEKVHRHGRRYSSKELIKNITGKDKISCNPLFSHLESCFPLFFK